MESSTLNLIAGIMIGMGISVLLLVYLVRRAIGRFEVQIRDLAREAAQEVEKQMLGVLVEEHNGQLYFYRENDRQFLCQGSDLAEIRKRFAELYPDKIAYLSGGDPDLIERLKAELANLKKQETNETGVGV